nr:hypothetical protein [uncultured Oscillibacter sp.]
MGSRDDKRKEIPFLVKAVAVIVISLLLVPLVIFTALPNMFFGYGSSETEAITRMTERAMTIGGVYTSLEDFDGTQVDSIVTSIASEYEQNGTSIAEQEENESCREMIEDNIAQIGQGVASDAIRHRFFLIFQYESHMKSKGHSVAAIIQRLNEEADTARRYLDVCELEVLEPRYTDDFVLKLLYEIINKRTSRRVKLPEGVFDMTTAVHGIYEE